MFVSVFFYGKIERQKFGKGTGQMDSSLKNDIISVVAVNVVCFGFIIFTVFMQFGINIKVIKKVNAVPVDIGYVSETYYRRGYGSTNIPVCMVELKTDSDKFDSVWVEAKDFFKTDNEIMLKKKISAKESVKINIFYNPKKDEILGITKKGGTVLSLINDNNKLVRYGSVILVGVDLFVLSLMYSKYRRKK